MKFQWLHENQPFDLCINLVAIFEISGKTWYSYPDYLISSSWQPMEISNPKLRRSEN